MPATRYFTRFTRTQVELIPSGFSLALTNEILGELFELSRAQSRLSQLKAIIVESVERYLLGFPNPSVAALFIDGFGWM